MRHVCEVCKQGFDSRRWHSRYCSNRCRQYAYRLRKARALQIGDRQSVTPVDQRYGSPANRNEDGAR